jgi:hypothetical protein
LGSIGGILPPQNVKKAAAAGCHRYKVALSK